MKNVEWGKFRIGDLFEINSSKKIFHANNLDNIFEEKRVDTHPYVVRTTQNNGIRGFIKENFDFLNEKNTFSFAQDTFSVFYQKYKYFTGNKVKILKPKFQNQKENIMMYLMASFHKSLSTFTWGIGSTVESISNTTIQLPIKNNKIDFDFMERFVAEIENERILKLENYINEIGLSDYCLTEQEKEALESFGKGKILLKEYKLGDLFTINTYKKRFDANKVNITNKGEPYVVRTSVNNGVRGYIVEDKRFLNKGNTISFGQDTATVFYQEQPYFTGDKIKVLQAKDSSFNRKNAFYFIASMTKSFSSFSWGSSSFSIKIIKEQPIQIPVKNDKPDYKTIETVISAIHKLVIKDVVLYVEKKKKELSEFTENVNA